MNRNKRRDLNFKGVFTINGNRIHAGHKQRGQQAAAEFMGRDPCRIWTGSQRVEDPHSHENSASHGSSVSRRGSSPVGPFSPEEQNQQVQLNRR